MKAKEAHSPRSRSSFSSGTVGRGFFPNIRPRLIALAVLFLAIVPLASAADPPQQSTTSPEVESSTEATTSSQPAQDYSTMFTGDWFGFRTKLANAGVTIGATLVAEGFANFMGGIDSSNVVGSTTFDLTGTFDLQKLVNLPGGEVFIDLESHAFRNPTTALTGDLQVFDKTNTSPYLQIFEFWYQQTFFDGTFRVKIGKVDANTEFDFIQNGLVFISSSSQLSPTIFLMPTTPDPMPSINLFFTPKGGFFASFGAYYANLSDRFGEIVDDPASVQPTRHGAFLIGETGFLWDALPRLQYAGDFKIGAWGQTGTFNRFDGTQQNGTAGAYFLLDQTLYQPPGEPPAGRGVRTFVEGGVTQALVTTMDYHAGAGITLTGPTQSRAQDVMGIGAQYAQISNEAGLIYPYELAVETFYQFQATGWLQFQPDLQYIVHPGGKYDNALVLTLRCTIQF